MDSGLADRHTDGVIFWQDIDEITDRRHNWDKAFERVCMRATDCCHARYSDTTSGQGYTGGQGYVPLADRGKYHWRIVVCTTG